MTGGQPEKTDFTPPELTAVSLEETEFVAGEKVKIQFEANDAGSGLRDLNFYFRHEETGDQFSLSDSENDGTATRNLSTNTTNGSYYLDYVRVYDNAGNYVNYRKDGTFQYRDELISTDIQGIHEIDFSSLNISVSGGSEIQTDYTPPELISLTIDSTEVPAGERFLINYSAIDTEHNIAEARFNFRNEDGSQSFNVYDHYGDGVASYHLSTNQLEDQDQVFFQLL